MNRAQRLTLKIVLAIDLLLILFPPFQFGPRSYALGHHWLPYLAFNQWGSVGVDVERLAAEIVIVSIIGFTVFVLARNVPDDRFTRELARLQITSTVLRETTWPRAGWTVKRAALWIAGIIGIGLAVLGIDLAVTAHDWPTLAGGVFVCIAGTAACVLTYLLDGSA